MALPLDQQLREVARCYAKAKAIGLHQAKAIGLKPKRSFAQVARDEFGANSSQVWRAREDTRKFMARTGIPALEEERKSPCHNRLTFEQMRRYDALPHRLPALPGTKTNQP